MHIRTATRRKFLIKCDYFGNITIPTDSEAREIRHAVYDRTAVAVSARVGALAAKFSERPINAFYSAFVIKSIV